MRVLQLSETEVSAFSDTASGMRIDVTAQRHARAAIRRLGVTVEVRRQATHASFITSVARGLLWMLVAGQQVQRLDCCHAMALPHQPATCLTGQGVKRQVAGIGRHHVQRATGMTFRHRLEVLGLQRLAIEPNALGIGHVHHQPEAGCGQRIQGAKQAVDARQVGLQAALHQLMGQTKDGGAGLQAMLNRSVTGLPAGKVGVLLSVLSQGDSVGQ